MSRSEAEQSAYDAGRYNGAIPADNWDAYQRGKNDRAAWDAATSPSPPPARPSGNAGGGGGLGILLVLGVALVVAAVLIAGAIVAAAAALIAAGMVWVFARFLPGTATLSYFDAYKASFFGFAAYLVMTVLIGQGVTSWVNANYQVSTWYGIIPTAAVLWKLALTSFSAPEVAKTGLDGLLSATLGGRRDLLTVAGAFSLLHGPGVLAHAIALSRWGRGPFRGAWGFLVACLVSVVVVSISVVLTAWAFTFLAGRAEYLQLEAGSKPASETFAPLFLVLGYSILGTLVGGLLIYLVARVRPRRRRQRLGRALVTALIGLVVYAVLTAIVMSLFSNGDALVAWMHRSIKVDGLFPTLIAGQGSLLSALGGFFLLQLPALLLVSAIIAARLDETFEGVAGFAAASGVATLIVLAVVLPTLAIATKTVGSQLSFTRVPLLERPVDSSTARGLAPQQGTHPVQSAQEVSRPMQKAPPTQLGVTPKPPESSSGAPSTQPERVGETTIAQTARTAPEAKSPEVFDGIWHSNDWRFGFKIEGKVGIATASNSPRFKPGDRVLQLESVSEKSFRGQQMFTNGQWVAVSGELVDRQTIKMQGGGFIWTMSRR